MGFAVPASAAILFTAVAIAGTAVTGALLDSISQASAAQREAMALAEEAARTEITVTSVTRQGQTVTVTGENTGSTTLDATEVQLLADGLYKTLTSRKVDNSATNTVWAPGTILELKYSGSSTPTTASLIPETGTPGYWRA